jgi:hypothetical protein
MLVQKGTGEIVHPGDYDELLGFREKQRQRKKRSGRQPSDSLQAGKAGPDEHDSRDRSAAEDRTREASNQEYSDDIMKPGWAREIGPSKSSTWGERGRAHREVPNKITCTSCGEETTDWVVRHGRSGTGKCRKCVGGRS